MTDLPSDPNFFNKMGGELKTDKLTKEEEAALAAFEQEGMKEDAADLPISYPRIKILHQDTAAFQFVEGDEVVKSFNGAILVTEKQRAWWKTAYGEGEGNKVPDCFSRDLVKPDPKAEDVQNPKCGTCPMNEWGSEVQKNGDAGRGKACKEVRRLFVLPAGRLLPHWIMVPPSSLKALGKYYAHLRDNGIKRPQLVVTKFGVNTVANRDNVKYSELALGMGESLNDKAKAMILGLREGVMKTLETAAVITKEEFEN